MNFPVQRLDSDNTKQTIQMAVFQINHKANEKYSRIFTLFPEVLDQIFPTRLIIGVQHRKT
jgi:hypothetical protein